MSFSRCHIKGAFGRIFLFSFILAFISGFTIAQNQETLPVFALRCVESFGPNFESFNPIIAVYPNGTVIFKEKDSISGMEMYFGKQVFKGISNNLLIFERVIFIDLQLS